MSRLCGVQLMAAGTATHDLPANAQASTQTRKRFVEHFAIAL
jgi:hypothetical protein